MIIAALTACAAREAGDSRGGGGTGISSGPGTGDDEGSETGTPGEGDGSSGSTTATSGSGTTGSGSGSSTTGSSSSGDEGSPRFDVGTNETESASAGEGTPEEGCSKVDFLFVVDSSGSMAGEQQNLKNSFPGFINAIQNTLQAKDYHIMVVDTDAQSNGGILCELSCAFGTECEGVPCSMIQPDGPCDTTLGAGRINSMVNVPCGVTGAQRYLIDGQPDIGGVFGCLAEVGTNGSGDEQQAGAAVAAVSPALNGPGGCNEGFLRDDAILVVTIITDEEDGPNDGGDDDTSSTGDPVSWKQALINAKLGNEGAVVVLGLIGDGDIGGICPPGGLMNDMGAEPGPNLRLFLESFMYGTTGSVCSPDYAPFFTEAISVIDTACDSYVPPG